MIAIIDYDAGNIKSVEKALISLGPVSYTHLLHLQNPCRNQYKPWLDTFIILSGIEQKVKKKKIEENPAKIVSKSPIFHKNMLYSKQVFFTESYRRRLKTEHERICNIRKCDEDISNGRS